MAGIQSECELPRVNRAVARGGTKRGIRPHGLKSLAVLMLLASSVAGMAETFPQVHNEPITIRILDGKDGHPISHVHLTLIAGYSHRDLHLGMWHADLLTNNLGKVRLPDVMANLPFLQISVEKRHMCQSGSGAATFSVESIRRDGLSTPNRCGFVAAESAPGILAVFVRDGRVASQTLPHAPSIPAGKTGPLSVRLPAAASLR